MITREELKVGERYINPNSRIERTVKFVGDEKLMYFHHTRKVEEVCDVKWFIEAHESFPKPKKKIKVVEFVDSNGDIMKCTKERFGQYHGTYTVLSEYEIEVEDV